MCSLGNIILFICLSNNNNSSGQNKYLSAKGEIPLL